MNYLPAGSCACLFVSEGETFPFVCTFNRFFSSSSTLEWTSETGRKFTPPFFDSRTRQLFGGVFVNDRLTALGSYRVRFNVFSNFSHRKKFYGNELLVKVY